MYDQLTEIQTTVNSVEHVPVFGYTQSALEQDSGIAGHNEYSDTNANNIPLADGTGLSLQEIEKGFRDSISSLSKSFFTHFFGRSSFNLNKFAQLMSLVLGTYKVEYVHNFRAWDNTATYNTGDVCFLVANGIRYCLKSLLDNNTAPVSASDDGILTYDSAAWVLLTELRTAQVPVGKPFLWFGGELPDNIISFSNGAQYSWADYPDLNTSEFRSILARFVWKGAGANETGFTAPVLDSLYPISAATIPRAISTITAKVPPHRHALNNAPVSTVSTVSENHTHPVSTSVDGQHQHYVGDYFSTETSVPADGGWHEDSKFKGGSSDILLTPELGFGTSGKHTVTAPEAQYSHSHLGDITSTTVSGFGAPLEKYRPGTIKTILVLRAF